MNKLRRLAAALILIGTLALVFIWPAFLNPVFGAGPVWVNWGYIFEELLTNRYYSHGCFHLTPLATKIFYDIVPRGTKVIIKSYQDRPGFRINSGVPDLLLCINSAETLKEAREAFSFKDNVLIEAYPHPGIFVFYYNNSPYAKLRFRPGYEKKGLMYFGRQNGAGIFDDYLVTPTAAGEYKTFYYTDYLLAGRYPLTTAIPYGEKIYKKGAGYFYKKNNREWPVPSEIVEDFKYVEKDRAFSLFEEVDDQKGQLVTARWGSHDYGIYVIGLSANEKTINQDLIYATGLVLNDQREILGNLAKIMVSGNEELASSIELTGAFKEEKIFNDFLNNPYGFDQTGLPQETRQYLTAYKFFNRAHLSADEKKQIDPVYLAAFNYFNFGERRLTPSEQTALLSVGAASIQKDRLVINKEKVQGIYDSLYELAFYVECGAKRYQKLQEFWPILMQFKTNLAQTSPGPLSELNIKKIILDHLELKN